MSRLACLKQRIGTRTTRLSVSRLVPAGAAVLMARLLLQLRRRVA
jgi:hypothetical protein